MKDANLAKIIYDICSERPAVGDLACLLYDELSKLALRSPNVFISYRLMLDIAISNKALASSFDDADFYSAIQVLCNPNVNFLRLNYQFIDDEFEPIDISISEIVEAEENDGLEHPYTGEILKNYKSYVFPFFTVNKLSKEGTF